MFLIKKNTERDKKKEEQDENPEDEL